MSGRRLPPAATRPRGGGAALSAVLAPVRSSTAVDRGVRGSRPRKEVTRLASTRWRQPAARAGTRASPADLRTLLQRKDPSTDRFGAETAHYLMRTPEGRSRHTQAAAVSVRGAASPGGKIECARRDSYPGTTRRTGMSWNDRQPTRIAQRDKVHPMPGKEYGDRFAVPSSTGCTPPHPGKGSLTRVCGCRTCRRRVPGPVLAFIRCRA